MTDKEILERQLARVHGYMDWDQRALKSSTDEVLNDFLLKHVHQLKTEERSLVMKIRDMT